MHAGCGRRGTIAPRGRRGVMVEWEGAGLIRFEIRSHGLHQGSAHTVSPLLFSFNAAVGLYERILTDSESPYCWLHVDSTDGS